MSGEFGVVGAVERAMTREARLQGAALRNGLGSLKIISAVAMMVGTVGMLEQLSVKGFRSMGTSASTAMAMTTGAISDSLSLIGLGLAVSILAFLFHSYLSGCVEDFDSEMNVFPRQPEPRGGGIPLFNFGRRMHRFGVMEMIWPRLESDADGEAILSCMMSILFGCGVVALVCCVAEGFLYLAMSLVMIIGLGGLAVKRGSRVGSLLMAGFFGLAAVICAQTYSWVALWALMVPLVLMVGSVRVVWRMGRESGWILNGMLLGAIGFFWWVAQK